MFFVRCIIGFIVEIVALVWSFVQQSQFFARYPILEYKCCGMLMAAIPFKAIPPLLHDGRYVFRIFHFYRGTLSDILTQQFSVYNPNCMIPEQWQVE